MACSCCGPFVHLYVRRRSHSERTHMSQASTPTRSVAIVGGGMAGTLAAIRLLRQARTPLLIRIFDPNPELGRGLAYATTDFNHRLNGPAKAFSLRPGDATHFAN